MTRRALVGSWREIGLAGGDRGLAHLLGQVVEGISVVEVGRRHGEDESVLVRTVRREERGFRGPICSPYLVVAPVFLRAR